MPGTNRDPRIAVQLNLREIIDVIESLPIGHPVLPLLEKKRETLLAIYKLKFRDRETKRHEIWCPMARYPYLDFINPSYADENCTCLKERGKK